MIPFTDEVLDEKDWPEVIERLVIDRIAIPDLVVGDVFMFSTIGDSRRRTVTAIVKGPWLLVGQVYYEGGPERIGNMMWPISNPDQSPVVWRIMAHAKKETGALS